jgi:hypothetical protein
VEKPKKTNMGREDMFLGTKNEAKEELEKDKEVKLKNKIRTIGPDGSVIESDNIKEGIEKVEKWDKQ